MGKYEKNKLGERKSPRLRRDENEIIVKNIADIPVDEIKQNSVTQIFIDGSKTKDFPKGFESLDSIRSIHLHDTTITDIPDEICALKNLEKLCIHSNKINRITQNISSLKNLHHLHLGQNRLSSFPVAVLDLPKLKSLILYDNKISHLPNEAIELSSLVELDLQANLFKIPNEIYEQKPAQLIQYILDFQNAAKKKPLHEAKLIFIGSGEVGKTSLINRVTKNVFNPDEQKTDGIEIIDWEVAKGANRIKLHIWDFGGQEIMHATHKFFMTSRSAYVLVINPRTQDNYGDSELEYWLKLIRSYAGEVPIVVVVNKSEIHRIDIAKGLLKDKYPNIVGFVETSCLENTGINKLKKLISKAVANLDFIEDELPQSYFDIKTKLERINKEYIEYSEYESICKTIDSDFKSASQKTLVKLLHDLGVMLNFSENRMLKNTQVLNPEWVTQGVYQIINYPDLVKNKGVLQASELSNILEKSKYPSEKEWYYITDIMGHFELSYQLSSPKSNYFIPAAFPRDVPKLKWEKEKGKLLRFQFHYDVLPNSIISRFMVKVHRLIRGSDYWLNGVVINYDKCDALIKADPEEKIIYIEIDGDGNRRAMLSIIREKFEDVHSNFTDIQIRRIIPIDPEENILVSYDDLVLYEEAKEEYIFIPQLKSRYKVKYLLDGIESEKSRKDLQSKHDKMIPGLTLFISYSHNDEELKDKLKGHLSGLIRSGTIKAWDDREILPGKEWDEEINHFLKTSQIVLLLISSDFLSSDYCYSHEMQQAVKNHEKGESIVIPIILRACDWSKTPFAKLQGLPKDTKPVTSWTNEDEAFTNISKEIRRLIESFC